jgi:hypothetical protein
MKTLTLTKCTECSGDDVTKIYNPKCWKCKGEGYTIVTKFTIKPLTWGSYSRVGWVTAKSLLTMFLVFQSPGYGTWSWASGTGESHDGFATADLAKIAAERWYISKLSEALEPCDV